MEYTSFEWGSNGSSQVTVPYIEGGRKRTGGYAYEGYCALLELFQVLLQTPS